MQSATTIVAVVSVKPTSGKTNGKAIKKAAPMRSVFVFEFISLLTFEFRHAFAEQPTWAQQENEEHQNIHGGFRRGRKILDGD